MNFMRNYFMFTTNEIQGERFSRAECDMCNSALLLMIDEGYSEEEASNLITNLFVPNIDMESAIRKWLGK